MKNQVLLFASLIAIFILGACSPFEITRATGQQPTPVVESLSPADYQPVQVDQVRAEVGVGSPVPVQVIVSGTLPDTCAQIELMQQRQEGSTFKITLSAVTSGAEGCVRDGPPFTLAIPLNIVNAPAGSYTVEVNGSRADFRLETGNTGASVPLAETSVRKDDIRVDSVNVDIGVGSPVPVRAIVGLSLPDTCAQLSEIRLHRDGRTFYVRLIAGIPQRADCRADSLPFRLEVPLNIINLPEGPYEVNVNGVTASFDPRTKPAGSADGPLPATCTEPVDLAAIDGDVSYDGISFKLYPALASSVIAVTCPALPFSEDQAPGEAHPPYTGFFFQGFSRQNVDFQPEMRVYEVTSDMQDYVFPLNMLGDLRSTLDQRPQPVTWFHASPLHARQSYLSFAGGAGVVGVVQYMQDFFFFTNNGLTYEFNGLTQDGRYFVSVRYPLSVPFLMELSGSKLPPVNLNPQAISIPGWPDDFEQQQQVISAYNAEALRRLEQMQNGDGVPDLGLLDALVQSIQISKP